MIIHFAEQDRNIKFTIEAGQLFTAATASTSWDKQACTHDTLWRQYYI